MVNSPTLSKSIPANLIIEPNIFHVISTCCLLCSIYYHFRDKKSANMKFQNQMYDFPPYLERTYNNTSIYKQNLQGPKVSYDLEYLFGQYMKPLGSHITTSAVMNVVIYLKVYLILNFTRML